MVARISYVQQQAVLAERAKGRTDRQIEKVVGIPSGTLSRAYVVDVSEQADMVRRGRETAAYLEREARRYARMFASDRPIIQGWRPAGDCIRSRPTPQPFRPQRPRHG